MQSKEIRPCPFCGDQRIDLIFDQMEWGYAMTCEHCLARGPVFGDADEAAEEWNVRHPPRRSQTVSKPLHG